MTVEVLSAVRVSGDTWQVDWRESAWDKNGSPSARPVVWRAMLRTLLQAPKTAQAAEPFRPVAPIDELHWDKVGGSPHDSRLWTRMPSLARRTC